jgi:hypothetical protein
MLWKSVAGLAAAIGLYAALRSAGFYSITAHEVEGIAVLVQLVGDIYAVLLAFVIFVIWGQFTDVENCVMRECNALADLLRFSRYLDADSQSAVRHAVANYTAHVLRLEWDSLADGRPDPQAALVFSKLVTSVVETANPRLIDLVQKAGERRDDRVSKSLTRIPPTLVALVNTIAATLLLLVFVYPFKSWYAGAIGFVLVAAILLLANFVMLDTDNPLKGAWNVSSSPFSRVA